MLFKLMHNVNISVHYAHVKSSMNFHVK